MRARGDLDRANIPLVQQLVTNAVYDGTIKDFAGKRSKLEFEGWTSSDGKRQIASRVLSEMGLAEKAFGWYDTQSLSGAFSGAANLATMFLLRK